jgi:hypothetical protein
MIYGELYFFRLGISSIKLHQCMGGTFEMKRYSARKKLASMVRAGGIPHSGAKAFSLVLANIVCCIALGNLCKMARLKAASRLHIPCNRFKERDRPSLSIRF